MLEYESFLKKMLTMRLEVPIGSFVSEHIHSQFYLYSFISWSELSVSVEALYRGLLSMSVSPKDARIKCIKLFKDIFPCRAEEARARFLKSCDVPKELLKSLCKVEPTTQFDSLDSLLCFVRDKAADLSYSNSKENTRKDWSDKTTHGMFHLVDDLYVVSNPRGLDLPGK